MEQPSRQLPRFHRQLVWLSLAFAVFLILDWTVVDRWHIDGTVSDAVTGEGISSVWVLAEFKADKPLLNLPIPPHPNHRSTFCMGARLTQSDAKGRFGFDSWTFNRASADKHAYLLVFRPEWIGDARSWSISSRILGKAPHAIFSLQKGPGDDIDAVVSAWRSNELALGNEQLRTSSELFAVTSLIKNQSCGYAGLELAIIAMNHALSIASTYDERDRVRAACKYIRNYSTTSLPKRSSTAERLTSGYPKRDWPFDCDNLQFKKPVPPDVLRVEAEVAAERRARITASKQGS